MLADATVQEWTDLYDIAKITKGLKPWEKLSHDWIIALDLPGREEALYCIVTGQKDDNISIAIYPNESSLAMYSKYLQREDDKFQAQCEQNYLICYFCDRKDMFPLQLKKLRELEISFRGKNEWIQFVSVKPGYVPYMIDREEVKLIKDFLVEFNQFVKDFAKKSKKESPSLYRHLGDLDLQKLSEKIKKRDAKAYSSHLENMLDYVKKMPVTNKVLEFDLVYICSSVKDENLDRPAIARLAVLGENSSDTILDFKVILPSDDLIEEIYCILAQNIAEQGKPSLMYCKRDFCCDLLLDFCKQTGIKLERKESLDLVDELVGAI